MKFSTKHSLSNVSQYKEIVDIISGKSIAEIAESKCILEQISNAIEDERKVSKTMLHNRCYTLLKELRDKLSILSIRIEDSVDPANTPVDDRERALTEINIQKLHTSFAEWSEHIRGIKKEVVITDELLDVSQIESGFDVECVMSDSIVYSRDVLNIEDFLKEAGV